MRFRLCYFQHSESVAVLAHWLWGRLGACALIQKMLPVVRALLASVAP